MLLKRKLNEPCGCITNIIDPHTYDDVTVISLPAGRLQNISATTDRLCQITLKQKLSGKFDKSDHDSSMPNRVKAKIIG
jgi:hypothetical protein